MRKLYFILLFIVCLFNFRNYNAYAKENIKYNIHDNYIYRLCDNNMDIVKASKEEILEVNSVYHDLSFDKNIYTFKDKLFLSGIINLNDESYLKIYIYDIKDRENPNLISEYIFKGHNYLLKDKDDNIYISLNDNHENLILLSFDLNDGNLILKEEFKILGNVSLMYLNESDLYVFSSEDIVDSDFTNIYKFNISNTINYINKISFEGRVLKEEFINLYNGELYVVSEGGDNEIKIYKFERDLNTLESLDKIFNETIINLCFNGNLCYITTFLKEGNLYIYDLNSESTGEMSKISLPYSSYSICPIEDDKLLIMGNEQIKELYKNFDTNKTYEVFKKIGIKVNIIDIKDIKSPRFIHNYTIRNKYISSHPYNFILDNIIVCPFDNRRDNNYDIDINSALEVSSYNDIEEGIYIFNISENKVELLGTMSFDNLIGNINDIHIINNELFIFNEDSIYSLNLNGEILKEYEFKKRGNNT